MPKRIQLSRKRPWRADHPDAVIVDGRTKWGNPFKVGKWTCLTGKNAGKPAGPTEVVKLFRDNLSDDGKALIRAELAGRDLACCCPLDQPCHADVLLAIANGGGS